MPLPCATRWSLAAAATLFSMEWRRTKPSNRWKDGYFNHFAADAVLYGTRRTDYEVDRRKRRGEEGRRESMKIALKAGIRSHAMGKREGERPPSSVAYSLTRDSNRVPMIWALVISPDPKLKRRQRCNDQCCHQAVTLFAGNSLPTLPTYRTK